MFQVQKPSQSYPTPPPLTYLIMKKSVKYRQFLTDGTTAEFMLVRVVIGGADVVQPALEN